MRIRTIIVLLGACLTMLAAVALAGPAAALVSTGDGTWFWRSPQPQGAWLNALCNAGPDLIAVGEGGTVLSSADAGATWQPRLSGTWRSLNDATFIDSLTGWAVGGETDYTGEANIPRSVIVHTTDGGLTWSPQKPFGHKPLQAVTFIDASTGWTVGDGGTVQHTSDGGLTWKIQRSGTSEDLSCVVFRDATHGWIGGPRGAVLRTRDGGQHWSRAFLPSWARGRRLIKPVFSDARRGFAILMNPDSWIDNGSGPALAATGDGGATWSLLPTPQHVDFTAMAVDGSGRLCAAAIDRRTDLCLFLYSDDSGRTWSRQNADVMAAQDMAATQDGLCAVGSGVLTRTAAGPWLPRSSWSWSPTHLQMFDDFHGVGIVPTWASFLGHTAFVTTNDGATWDVTSELPLTFIAAVHFADSQNGWVVGSAGDSFPFRGIVLRTSDGGQTWQRQTTSLKNLILEGASFPDASHGWVCGMNEGAGNDPRLYATSDGGITWSRQSLPPGFEPADLDFISPLEGWTVGMSIHGRVSYHTVDGGAHWAPSATALPGFVVFTTVSFIDGSHGWATGYDASRTPAPSVVCATSDGGRTWSRQGIGTSLEDYPLTGVAFVDAERGWLFAGDDNGFLAGGIWQTTDGGATWTAEQQPVGSGGISGSSVVGGVVYAGSAFGFLSTLDRSGDSAPPSTYDDFDGRYHRTPVAIGLVANDIGGGTVAQTQYRVDDDPAWHEATGPVVFPAPADHSGDGRHHLYYRSIDSAGNIEPSGWWVTVPIDTLGPTTAALGPVTAARGSSARLRYEVNEATSTAARVVVKLRDSRGQVVKTLCVRRSAVNRTRGVSFDCRLPRGRYSFTVYAQDLAGNAQVRAGRGWLIVKPSGWRARSSASQPAVSRLHRAALPLPGGRWQVLRRLLVRSNGERTARRLSALAGRIIVWRR